MTKYKGQKSNKKQIANQKPKTQIYRILNLYNLSLRFNCFLLFEIFLKVGSDRSNLLHFLHTQVRKITSAHHVTWLLPKNAHQNIFFNIRYSYAYVLYSDYKLFFERNGAKARPNGEGRDGLAGGSIVWS